MLCLISHGFLEWTKNWMVVSSLASHTLHREEGSGHVAADELLPRNVIIEQLSSKMLTFAKHVVT